MLIDELEKTVANITCLTEPIVIGKYNGLVTNQDIKITLLRMNDYGILENFLPLQSLKSLDQIQSLSYKGITDTILEYFSLTGIKHDSGIWGDYDKAIHFFHWQLANWIAKNGYGKPILLSPKIKKIVDFLPRFVCPLGCYNPMMVNLNLGYSARAEFYTLWLIDHLKSFHKLDFRIIDSKLNLTDFTLPDIYEKVIDHKAIMPKTEYLNNSVCPACKGKNIAIVDLENDLAICENNTCNFFGDFIEFSIEFQKSS